MAVCHGTANAKKVMENISAGGQFSQCHFIEFMACPGGCLGGGGQPIPTSPAIRAARAKAIYAEDSAYQIRKSHENPAIVRLYQRFLTDGPCGAQEPPPSAHALHAAGEVHRLKHPKPVGPTPPTLIPAARLRGSKFMTHLKSSAKSAPPNPEP